MVLALVVEEAGFLAAHEIGQIDRAVHGHLDRTIDRAARDLQILVKPFEVPGPRGGIDHQRARAGHVHQRPG